MPLLSATIFLCESALQERNGIYSALRIADVLQYQLIPDYPLERQTIHTTVFAVFRFDSEDVSDHTAEVRSVRPDGTESALGDAVPIHLANVTATPQSATKTLYITVDLRIVPRQDGINHVTLLLDDHEVGRFTFTLVRAEAQTSERAAESSDPV